MTQSFFYTDQLAAAWMAKHFGMRLQCIFNKSDDCISSKDVGNPYPFEHAILSAEMWEDAIAAKCRRIHIHPDSQHLLQPQVGDILRLYFDSPEEDDKHGAVMTGFYAGGREALTWFRNPKDGSIDKQLHRIDDHQWRIIQRDRLAFHWPESEES